MAVEKRTQRLAFLEKLSTNQLEELVRADFENNETSDQTFISDVLSVLSTRTDSIAARSEHMDVDRAWDAFNNYYNTEDGKDCYLYACDIEENQVSSTSSHPQKKHFYLRTSVAAILIFVLFGGVLPTVVGAENVFSLLGRWTDSAFSFLKHEVPNEITPDHAFTSSNEDLCTIYDTLVSLNIKERIMPSWIPDRFSLESVDTTTLPGQVLLNATFSSSDDGVLSITIVQLTENAPGLYEKDNTLVDCYQKNEINHYIMHNKDQIQCTWALTNLECAIFGTVSKEELYTIIDSIYIGGETN